MGIGFYNFQKLHHAEFQKRILERFTEIVSQNAFVEGKYNFEFEERFAKMQGTKHALLVANGTDAIEVALKAYGVGSGDLVGVPTISFYASAEAILNVGATPVFIDVDATTGLMDPASLEKISKTHNLKAIVPVHIYGQAAPIEELEKICLPKDIHIVEDGAQSQGGFYHNGKPIGSSNNLITYSFYPTKNLGAFGDAGAVLTQSDELKERIVQIRNHGRTPNGHALIGRNSRCDHLQAAVLSLKLETIETENKQRKEIAKKYFEALSHLDLKLLPKSSIETSSWHLYPVRLKNAEQKYALKNFLQEREIGSALFYEKAMCEEMPLKQYQGDKEKGITFAAQTLCLPMNPFLTDDDIQTIAKTIEEFLQQ